MKRYLTHPRSWQRRALFFALRGQRTRRTGSDHSTSQVKPSVIKALHGEQGAIGNTGRTEPRHQRDAGPSGAAGATGSAGIAGCDGCHRPAGDRSDG